ncbi:MAG: hypothetical protein V1667_02865 [bacterium]
MLKINTTNRIILKLSQAIIASLISFIFLNIIIFSLQIIYPAPSWRKICGNNCTDTQNEHSAITNADIIYRSAVQKIFYVLSLFFILTTYATRKKENLKYIFSFLSISAFLFAYFTTRGHQWYFEFGTEPPNAITSVFIVVILSIFNYWIFKGCKKLKINLYTNDI